MRFNAYSLLTLVILAAGMVILLTNQSDDAVILGRYSARYLLLVLGYFGVMMVGILLVSLPPPKLPGWFWLGAACISLLVIAWLPLLGERPLLNIALKLSFGWVVIATVLRAKPVIGNFKRAAIVGALLLLSLSLLTLKDYPYLQTIDEGWDANLAWTFVHEGVLYTRMNQGVFGIPEMNVPTTNVLPGYWMLVAGVGLLQVRLVVWFGGLVFIALIYATARRLYREQAVAIIAALAALCSVVLLYNSHLFRLDIWLGVAGVAAFYLYLRAAQQAKLALLAGFLLAGGIEIHQNALAMCVGSGAFIALSVVARSIRQRRLAIEGRELWFAAGGMLGAALFLTLHVLPNPAEFARQLSNSLNIRSESINAGPRLFGPLTYLADMLNRVLLISPFEAAALLPLVVGGLHSTRTRALTLLLLLVVGSYGLVSPALVLNYLIDFWGLIFLIFAGLMVEWVREKRVIVLVLCCAFVAPTVVTMVQLAREARNDRLIGLATQIAGTLAPDERVVALHYFFFAMPDNPNLIAPFMPEYSVIAGKDTPALDVWQQYAPDVFIVSPVVSEPTDTAARSYREQEGFQETGRYDDVGCCIYVYRRAADE